MSGLSAGPGGASPIDTYHVVYDRRDGRILATHLRRGAESTGLELSAVAAQCGLAVEHLALLTTVPPARRPTGQTLRVDVGSGKLVAAPVPSTNALAPRHAQP